MTHQPAMLFYIVAASTISACPNAVAQGCEAESMAAHTRRLHRSPADGVTRHHWLCACPWARQHGTPAPDGRRRAGPQTTKAPADP